MSNALESLDSDLVDSLLGLIPRMRKELKATRKTLAHFQAMQREIEELRKSYESTMAELNELRKTHESLSLDALNVLRYITELNDRWLQDPLTRTDPPALMNAAWGLTKHQPELVSQWAKLTAVDISRASIEPTDIERGVTPARPSEPDALEPVDVTSFRVAL